MRHGSEDSAIGLPSVSSVSDSRSDPGEPEAYYTGIEPEDLYAGGKTPPAWPAPNVDTAKFVAQRDKPKQNVQATPG